MGAPPSRCHTPPLLLPPLPGLPQNLELVEAVKALAAKKGCTAGQLALAWVHAQGEDVFPIPGTKRIKYARRIAG